MSVYLVAGLAYGDEGKGATVDFLTRCHNAKLIIRYNGGPQAAHNVVTSDGRHHTFSQFGSGMFVEGVKTFLSRFMLVNPINMMCEEEHLREVSISDAWSRLIVDQDCVIVTPYHRAVNRILEKCRDNRHGSCGQGIGEARELQLKYGEMVLRAGDLRNQHVTKSKLEWHRQKALDKIKPFAGKVDMTEAQVIIDSKSVDWTLEQYKHWPAKVLWYRGIDYLADELKTNSAIFEGAQGFLIDEHYGVAPYNTWTDCTFNNAEQLLIEAGYTSEKERIGVLRTYFTRHGPGPFPTENHQVKVPELHNCKNEYQGSWRQGTFDFKQACFAIEKMGGVDYIALNHFDALPVGKEHYEFVIKDFEEKLPKIGIKGYGPTSLERAILL